MTMVRVFDPAMCCSTGICGASVDPQLVRFAADLEWLGSRGVSVERFNLSQQPGAFAEDAAVRASLEAGGEAALPLVKVDGEVRSSGVYPSRDDLSAWAGLDVLEPSLYTDGVAELVAIGAAIASNCEPCFRFHYDQARRVGVSREDMARAVATAQAVKDTPANAISELAGRYLRATAPRAALAMAAEPDTTQAAGACCSPSEASGDAACGCDAAAGGEGTATGQTCC